jgi:inosose dehydratase
MSNIKIANAPCSWGALEFELEGKALQYSQVLDEMVETGYTGTELGDWGFMPTNPAQLSNELTKRKLKLLGAFVPVDFKNNNKHKDGLERALKTAELMKTAGFPDAFIILADENGSNETRTQNAGRITHDMGLNAEEWSVFARGAELIAIAVKQKFGMRTVFHHHCAGFVETPEEIDTLMKMTSKEYLGLCLDTGHYMFGGGNPVEALEKYGNRIWHVHFKDYNPEIARLAKEKNWNYFKSVENGVFCELGKGAVDFYKVADYLRKTAYEDWIVIEQDVLPGMGEPKKCAKHNREFLNTLNL